MKGMNHIRCKGLEGTFDFRKRHNVNRKNDSFQPHLTKRLDNTPDSGNVTPDWTTGIGRYDSDPHITFFSLRDTLTYTVSCKGVCFDRQSLESTRLSEYPDVSWYTTFMMICKAF